jgi:phage replication O-like protein O
MVARKSPTSRKFRGFQSPNTTPVPDELFDELMYDLTGAELKVLLYICRRTFGFKKESDNISLSQLVNGIKTRDGKVLDRGTGLSKDSVSRVVKSLEEKGIIVRNRRQSVERGYEATTYFLNIKLPKNKGEGKEDNEDEEDPAPQNGAGGASIADHPPLSDFLTRHGGKIGQGLGSKIGEALTRKSDIQQTVLQQTVRQHDDVVGQALQNFGISKSASTKLAKTYPEAHILDKLELARWLVSTGSPLVARNPAGFLRKAIEEDYTPPRNYQRSRQHQVRKTKDAKISQAEARAASDAARERRMAEEEYRRVKAESKAQLLEQYPPQPVGEEGLTTESVWDMTVKRLKEQVPEAIYETWLKDTVLLQVTDQAARIAVPSAFAVAWLERRLYREIASAIKGALGKDLDLQFVTA